MKPAALRSATVAAVAALTLVLGHAGGAGAGTSAVVPMVPGSGAEIWVFNYFSELPSSSFAPLRVRIKNATGADHEWTLRFESWAFADVAVDIRSERTFAVPKGTEKTFEIEVPLVGQTARWATPTLNITVSGHGASDLPVVLNGKANRGPSPVSDFAMSKSVAANNWEILKTRFSSELPGAIFDPLELPTDWRGYAGYGSVWMSESEWRRLDPGPRSALVTWVDLGGTLVLATQQPLPPGARGELPVARIERAERLYDPRTYDPSAAALPVPGPHPVREDPMAVIAASAGVTPAAEGVTVAPPWDATGQGYGAIVRIPWDGARLSNTAPALLETSRTLGEVLASDTAAGSLTSLIAPVAVHGGLLLLFLVFFSICVGPLNLFVLCRGNKRFHLFWTVPLMSIAATLGLGAVIFAADGTGGRGSRWTAVLLLPEERLALTVQEQIARTGALLSNRFTLGQPVVIQPVRTTPIALDNGTRRTLRQTGDVYSGGWFASRSLQAHLLESVQPSRSRVELVTPAGAGRGPEIVSSIDRPLEEIYVVSEDGRCWRAEGVRTGARATLAPCTREDFDRWWRHLMLKTGSRGRWLMECASERRGWFYASVAPAAAASGEHGAIATLGSIRWTQEALLFLGPCVPAGGGEGAL